MKFSVIGAGRTGQAMAAMISAKGHEVSLYDRNQARVKTIREAGIRVTGILELKERVAVGSDLIDCIRGAEFILVMTTAQGHRPVAEGFRNRLERGQTILVFNGNWGVVEFKTVLGEELKDKGVTLAETGAMLFLSTFDDEGVVRLGGIKEKITIAGIPKEKTMTLIRRLKPVFPQLKPVENPLITSLNNSNPILHVPIALLNAARIDAGEDFLFYAQGASPHAVDLIEIIDKERVDVARAMGVRAMGVVEIINSFWPLKHEKLFEAIHMNDSYRRSRGPGSLDHRYFTEDIPYGLVPLARLGRIHQVATPGIDGLIAALSLLLKRDFMKEGPDFSRFKVSDFI